MSDQDVHIKVFNDPFYAENGLVISIGSGAACWVVDPGLPPQGDEIVAFIAERNLQPEKIVLTHAHGDHIAGIDTVRGAFPEIPMYLAKGEWPLLTDANENLSAPHGGGTVVSNSSALDLAPGDELSLDGTVWKALDVSGHSPAGRALYCEALKLALVGDAVFSGSVGRTDFHHSNGEQLIRNIKENILTLPDDTTLIPGHGPATTVGQERTTNPYLQG
ncbi:MAG: putative metallo-hydrolase YqgX [Phycisphaerae bacterium]|nr:MAG: putative metallo-hydrolase YqgX [Phycisphaerae bacterium]